MVQCPSGLYATRNWVSAKLQRLANTSRDTLASVDFAVDCVTRRHSAEDQRIERLQEVFELISTLRFHNQFRST